MRYTSKDTTGTILYGQYDYKGTPLYEDSRLTSSAVGGVSRSDITKTRKVNGWREPTAYVMEDNVVHYNDGYYGMRSVDTREGIINGTSTEKWSGPCSWIGAIQGSNYPGDIGPPSNAQDLLANKILSKLRDQKINLALNMAELNKTADGVAQTLTKLTKSYRAFRRGDFKQSLKAMGLSTRRRGKDAASTWLELQYGILPLMGDIYGGYEEVTRKTRNYGQRIRVVARDPGDSRTYTESNIPVGLLVQGRDIFTGSVNFTSSYSAQLICWYEVDNPMLVAASSVGLTNPLEIIWELTPWSFVFDWFLPIGDYLGALTADQGFKFLGGSYTIILSYENTRELVANRPFNSAPNVQHTPLCSGSRVSKSKRMYRIPMGVIPTASLPSFKNPLSMQHALNAIALARSIR